MSYLYIEILFYQLSTQKAWKQTKFCAIYNLQTVWLLQGKIRSTDGDSPTPQWPLHCLYFFGSKVTSSFVVTM